MELDKEVQNVQKILKNQYEKGREEIYPHFWAII